MTKPRIIKPQFWEDEKVAAMSFPCRLFYIGTWSIADDNGVFRANPAFLKAAIFPYDAISIDEIEEWISKLMGWNMVIPFLYKEEHYYLIRTFKVHQKQDKRYPSLLVPAPVAEHVLTSYTNFPNMTPEIPNIPDEVIEKTWRDDYNVYLKGLKEAFESLKNDKEWILAQEAFYPGVDIIQSIRKACVNYWGTETGWKKKKLKQTKNIDWKSTFAKGIQFNKVYHERPKDTEKSYRQL